MRVGLHDCDGLGRPNLALMKLSRWHKSRGDDVEWWFEMDTYDAVYSSKVFTRPGGDEYLPSGAICGGTGYDVRSVLPAEVDRSEPDYDLYPDYPHALGFLTRGCPNKCDFCIVPKKEGGIRPYMDIDEFLCGRKSAVLMDNNVLACQHGLEQIEKIVRRGIKVDFNQGLDARLIVKDKSIAKLLGKAKWIEYVRMACDRESMMPIIGEAVAWLAESGIKPYRIFVYMLVRDIDDAYRRAVFLKQLGVTPFAQPYRDFENNIEPSIEQRHFARWVNHKAVFKTVDWRDYHP